MIFGLKQNQKNNPKKKHYQNHKQIKINMKSGYKEQIEILKKNQHKNNMQDYHK